MDANFVLAQIFGVLSMASSVCSMQFKKRRAILSALLCLNLFAALNMIFLKSWAAANISVFAIIEMLINFRFEQKKKEVPALLVGVYAGVIVLLGFISYEKTLDLFAILAALVFCFTVLMKKEQNIRRMMFLNQLLWLVFDIGVGAYALVASNVLTLVSTAIAYYRYSKIKKKRKR